MKSNNHDREYDKFREADNNLSRVAVELETPVSIESAQFEDLSKEETQLRVEIVLNFINDALDLANSFLDLIHQDTTNIIARLDTVITSLALVNTKLEEIKGKIDLTNTKLEEIKTKIDSTNLKLEDIKTKLDTANLKLEDIKTKLDTANNTLSLLYTRLNTFTLGAGIADANTLRVASDTYGQTSDGVLKPLRLSPEGEVIIHGVYHATQNPKPSSTGSVVHQRQNNPTDNHQTIRNTGISNGTVHAKDVSLFDNNGSPYTVNNRLPVTSVDYLQETIVTAAKTVGTTAIRASVGSNNLTGRKSLIVYNNGTVNVYYGASGVTVANGIHIAPQGYASFDVFETIDIFLIAASNAEVRISEAK